MIGLCVGQSLLPDMVLCLGADGHLAVEPAIGGKCSDLAPAVPAGEVFGEIVSAPAYCELCLDLPLADGATYQLPRPVQPRTVLLAAPVLTLPPYLQPPTVEPRSIDTLFPLLPIPSSALITLRTTVLLI